MVVGKIKKMLIAAIQHEEIMFASSGAGQNLVSQIHAVAQNQSMNILMAKLWGERCWQITLQINALTRISDL